MGDKNKEYLNLQYNLAQMKRQLPVNYLTDGTIYKGFNEKGNLVAVFDKYENMLTIEYDESGKITAVYDGDDKQIVFSYAPNGLLSSITDTRGRRTVYDYENGELIGVTFASGKSVALDYNASGYLTTVVSSEKMQSALSYTNNILSGVKTWSCVESIEHGAPSETANTDAMETLTFTWSETLATVEDGKGNKEYYTLSDEEKIIGYYKEQEGKVVQAELYDYTVYERDHVQYANKASLYTKGYTAFSGNDFQGGDSVLTELDEFNNPAKKTTSARALSEGTTVQAVVMYAYNDEHKCTEEQATVTVKQGTSVLKEYMQVTAYNYNASGNVVRKETYVVGEEQSTGKAIEETVYDEKGNKKKSYTYNSLDASSKFYTESEYAENGQVLVEYDETGENKTEYEYIDGTNVVRGQKLPNGSRFAYGHDADDTVTSITQSTAEGEENSTRTRYTCGEVTELVSGNNVVRYAYDKKRRVSKVYLNDLTTVYIGNTYTDNVTVNGVTTEKCESKNVKNETTVTYTDKQGKVRRITLATGETIDYAYNAKGEKTSVTDGMSGKTETYTYDETYDRLTQYARGTEYTEAYTYDGYGNVLSKVQSGAATRTYGYTYTDTSAREVAGVAVAGYTFVPKKDVNGRSTGREITVGTEKVAEEYITYRKVGDHATNQPASVYFGGAHNGRYGISENLKYEYDKNGNIVKISENGLLTVRYAYDSVSRLIREDNRALGKTWLYSYDNKGNILSKRETAFTLKADVEECEFTSVQYGYNGDELLFVGTEACTYDALGNPSVYRGKAVSWSNGRRMMSYGGTALTYDGLGRRLSKGNITYTYDGSNRVIKQSDGLEFLYDNDGVAAVVQGENTYLYRKDAQGNICALLDSNGGVVVKYIYDAWGNHAVVGADGNDITDEGHIGNKNPYRYRGYYYDADLKLYWLQTRYYDPETGRFVTIDDISYLDPETINGLNLYAYCGNNPVMNIDPTGTTAWWEWLLGIVIIVAAVALSIVTAGIAAPISAALGGGIVGALVGGAVAGAIGGAITGFAFSIATQGISNGFDNINWAQVGWDTLAGTLSGAISGAVFGGVKFFVGSNSVASSIAKIHQGSSRLYDSLKRTINISSILKDGLPIMSITQEIYYVAEFLTDTVYSLGKLALKSMINRLLQGDT